MKRILILSTISISLGAKTEKLKPPDNIVFQDENVTIIHDQDFSIQTNEIQYKQDWLKYKKWEYFK